MLARKLVSLLKKHSLKVAFAESCTGGLLAASLTAVSGSSAVIDMSVVTYANTAKTQLLGVMPETLQEFGAVSPQTAEQMLEGIKKISGADIVVSVTGIAGPTGGTIDKPVGLVYIGYGFLDTKAIEKNLFSGSRKQIREQVVKHVITKICSYME